MAAPNTRPRTRSGARRSTITASTSRSSWSDDTRYRQTLIASPAPGRGDLLLSLQRRIDGRVIFLLEARDQLGGADDLADAADTLPAAPNLLPGLRLRPFTRGIGAK